MMEEYSMYSIPLLSRRPRMYHPVYISHGRGMRITIRHRSPGLRVGMAELWPDSPSEEIFYGRPTLDMFHADNTFCVGRVTACYIYRNERWFMLKATRYRTKCSVLVYKCA